jgi:hypothetical protein
MFGKFDGAVAFADSFSSAAIVVWGVWLVEETEEKRPMLSITRRESSPTFQSLYWCTFFGMIS